MADLQTKNTQGAGKVLIAVLAVAGVLVIVALLAYFLKPVAAPSPDTDVEVKEANSLILSDLRDLGLTDVLVDVTDEQVLIRFNEPQGFANRSAVMAMAASDAPWTQYIMLQVFSNYQPKEQLIVNTSLALEYGNGQISEGDFSEAWAVSPLQ